MNGVALLIALSSLGVDFDVRQSEDGKLEYVIQVEPEYLRLLADGQQIHSDVPPEAGQVERVLLRVGTTAARHSPTHLAEYRRLLTSSARYASSVPGRAATDATTTIVWPAKSKPELNYHVTYGFQPNQTGGMDYYVQLNPTLLASLAVGDEVRATIDPAAGRVGRFVIHAGEAELPKVPAEPVAPPAPLAGLAGSRRGATDRTAFGAGNRGAAGAATQPAFGPPTGIAPSTSPPAERTATPLASTPDFGSSPSFGGHSQYSDRGGSTYGGVSDTGTELRAPASAPPAYQQPPAGYGDNRFDRLRNVAEQPPVEYSPPAGYATHQPAPQQQLPPRTNAFAPPAPNYNPQPMADDRVASVPRPMASAPLTAPQINPASNSRGSALESTEEKPYMALVFTAFALFLSIGGNLYLGWTAAEFYSRYRLATERLRSAGRS